MKLEDLGGAYDRLQVELALQSATAGMPDLVARVQKLGIPTIPSTQRSVLADGVYSSGKRALASSDFNQALVAFRLAQKLVPEQQLYLSRAKMLECAIAERKLVSWRGSLISLQRKLGVVCTKKCCTCNSHAQIARCRSLIGSGLRHTRNGVTIYTLAPYYSRWMGDRWTRLLKSVKKQFQADLLEPIADIAADFLIESTDVVRDLDAVVPVPPSTEKFGDRGFAPNDIVARHVGARLALPLRPVLSRRPGLHTRDATDEELEVQFEVRSSDGAGVKNLSVLLIEDIWTWGRTIPICALKLTSAGARRVVALALGKTEG